MPALPNWEFGSEDKRKDLRGFAEFEDDLSIIEILFD